MKQRDSNELAQELLEQADETRRLIARYSEESEAWRARALLACLRNDNVLLEALASLLATRPASVGSTPAPAPIDKVDELDVVAQAAPAAARSGEPAPGESIVDGPKARSIVEEFDNRDHMFDRGLDKLNQWVAGGKGGLPFQKRESHAYINRSCASEAMIARVESELMGREGFSRRLGRLKVDGLTGDILVYERGT